MVDRDAPVVSDVWFVSSVICGFPTGEINNGVVREKEIMGEKRIALFIDKKNLSMRQILFTDKYFHQ